MADLPTLREFFVEQPTSVGTTLKSVEPNMAEAVGQTPVDFLFVDLQHGSPLMEEYEDIVRAAELTDLRICARVPRDDTTRITYLMDLGTGALMLPQIESTAAVEEALSHFRYSEGRSIASTSRATGFGKVDRETYIEHVNEEIVLLPQIETLAGVDVVEELTAMESVDAIAIGPGDLSMDMNVEPGSAEVMDAVDDIFDVAAANDCAVGTFVGTPEGIERYAGRASFVVYNSDVGIVVDHFDRVLGDLSGALNG